MSNKQFKVMVVPRWFNTTPETARALAYVYNYHVRDLPAFFNPNALNINEALRALFRLEGIVKKYAVFDRTNWNYLQTEKKFGALPKLGFYAGLTRKDDRAFLNNWTDGNNDSETSTVTAIRDMLVKANDINQETLTNEQKWDSREYGANPDFVVSVTDEGTLNMLNKMRVWHKLRNGKDSALSIAYGPDLETKEVELPPGAFDQYNKDCVRQGVIEMELVEKRNQSLFNRSKETSIGLTKDIDDLKYRKADKQEIISQDVTYDKEGNFVSSVTVTKEFGMLSYDFVSESQLHKGK